MTLKAQGLERALEHLPDQVINRVLHSNEVKTLGGLWWASLGLAAVVIKEGNVLAATGLLNEWGSPDGRKALDNWLFRLDLDPQKLARMARRPWWRPRRLRLAGMWLVAGEGQPLASRNVARGRAGFRLVLSTVG